MLERLMCIAVKPEPTPGTAVTVAAIDAALNVYNFSMTPDEPVNERELMASKGSDTSSPGAQSGKCSFEVEICGNGSVGVPLWASVLLPPCDMQNSSGTFSFVDNSTATVTIVAYEDGLRRQLTGARGDFTATLVNGKPGRIRFDFTGKYAQDAETDAAILSPTFPTVLAPVFAGATVTVGGTYSPILSTVTFGAGNQVILREDATHPDKSGYRCAEIPSRKPVASMDPEQVTVATRDWRTKLFARAEEQIVVTVGSSANNTVTLTAGRAQTIKTAKAARNGVNTRNVNFQLNGASPLTIAFT